jgi:tetratricopeptide (TPR) repeat protein
MTLLLPLLILLAFVCLLAGWGIVRKLRVLRAQLAAYRKGDYLGQLEIIEGFRTRESEPSDYLFFRGSALLELGRLEEAERALRRSLSMETNPALRIVARDELGLVLMEQGRWDEAAACFQACIAENPARGGGHRGMAEVLLRQGEQRAAALDAARLAVGADRAAKVARGWLGKEEHDDSLSESLAFLAWALARNSADRTEVESAQNEAFALCERNTKPILARLHFCAGHAYAILGDVSESARHFRSACELDPLGNYGRLARSAGATAGPPT